MKRKFHVSLEAAKLLKEKGYNEETDCTIDYSGAIWFGEYRDDCDFPCITKAEAMDWLESKGMLIEISIDIDECAWIFNIVDKEKFITIGHTKDGEFFTDRLEAEEAAIIKACELL